jgi:integrase
VKKSAKGNSKQATSENTHFFIPDSINEAGERRKRRLRARRKHVSPASITFAQLKKHMTDRAGQPGLPSAASLSNLFSALSAFLEDQGLDHSHPVGSTFRMGFYKALGRHLGKLRVDRHPVAYIANRKYLLRAWKKLVTALDREFAAQSGSMTPLQAALQEVLTAGATVKGLAREAKMPASVLRRLCGGGAPTRRSMRYLPRLERLLGMTSGALTDLVGVGRSVSSASMPPATPIAYREMLRQLAQDSYILKKEFAADSLIEEWSSLFRFKTAAFGSVRIVDSTTRARKSTWRLREAGLPATFGDWVDTLNGRTCPSASVAFQMTSQFVGWLSLDRSRGGLGMPPEDAQSLGHFANTEYLFSYLQWRIDRVGGTPNQSIDRILRFARSLSHPGHGFLIVHPEIGKRVGVPDTAAWEARCRETNEQLKVALRNLPKMSRARDPFEPIRRILELENPLDAIVDAIRRIDADRPLTGGMKEATWARDRLLIALTASNPLRAANLKLLTWRPDNSGMLRKDSAGGSEIVIEPAQFKNQSGAAGDRPYRMPVQEQLWPFIDAYLRDYWPMLSRGRIDRVFISAKSPSKVWNGLNRRFEALTRRYLHGCPGVGPHSFRHIVATAVIKRTGSFAAAALILHDREETVREHYAHLIGADGARWLASVLRDAFRRR